MVTVSEIYDAAFDAALFPELLQRIAGAFDASSSFIAWVDQDRGAGFQAEHGNDPAWIARYTEIYHQHDVLMPYLLSYNEGDCKTVHALLQQPEIRSSKFYREYLAPHHVVDNMAAILVRRAGFSAHLTLLRKVPAPPFNAGELAQMETLMPHLKRAVFIQSRLIRDAGAARAYRQSASCLSGYLLQLTEDRHVVEIDAEVGRIVGLRIGDLVADTIFGKTVIAALAGDQPCAVEVRSPDGTPFKLLCEARKLVRDRFSDLVSGPCTEHTVHITIIDQPLQIAYGAMADMYRLTPTETRVLSDAVEKGDLTGIGERLGMARATTRAHLHRIYSKTGTNGFPRLASLAHRFAMAGEKGKK
ncbi:helix-turn-helix transcriptional regulator [Allopontixanthobacter sediminis]|uniref:HTH luxR-type domain-containing protein n=1 Tax=Allopontixanthobacter sediminis TaxID=1689985 RepID=A0A845B478_9SPHN|nr:hypothetical protein [Allopontixanthobacter sediminis]MXP44986.1 hypothetical protein [Allopontixanthobacter sediminis]